MKIQQNRKEKQWNITAAIEGTSDCPGEPCDTSIPKISVGTLEIKGIECARSTTSKEFIPPSCYKEQANKSYHQTDTKITRSVVLEDR